MKLYLFDFDGTLTKKDSMIEFLIYVNDNKFMFFLKTLISSPLLLILSIISFNRFKSQFLKIHLYKFSEEELQTKSKKFANRIIKNLYPEASGYLNNIKGEEKYIVTASLDIWMEEISKKLNCKLICTQSIFRNKKFASIKENCKGIIKKERIMKEINLEKFDEILTFGNSKNDKEMMSLGTSKYFKYFNK